MNNIVSPRFEEADQAELSVRPNYLDDFVGQEQIKENLKVFIQSSKSRNAALDHVILYGPPGLGKTTIAQIISKELGVNFKGTAGPIITKSGDLAALLTNLEPNDVLFIDEIHRLSSHVEEVLYPAMEDFTLDLIIGEGPSARTVRIDLPRFTLIAATTRMGLISNPLRDRFGIPLRLNFYSETELATVIKRAAKLLVTNIDEEGAKEIAIRSRGTPRIALRLFRRVRDFAIVKQQTNIDKNFANYALLKMEVDNFGLDGNDYRYLHFIAHNYSGGPVGIETIAAGLSEQKDSIEETIEPFLIQIGFLERTKRGRVITLKAFNHLGIKPLRSLMPENLFEDDE